MGIEIREATRKGVKLLIGLAGVSGSGKTYSAIQLAFGLVGKNANKIGMIDTENGRGSLYADCLGDGNRFLIGDMLPPFAPQRYTDAIKAFVDKGVDVVVIDSFTHAWEGEGGAKDIAELALENHLKCKQCGYTYRANYTHCPMCNNANAWTNKGKQVADWIKAKAEWKKMLNNMLLANCHVIVCMRARDKVRVAKEKDPDTGKEKLVYVSEGLQMVVEKNAPFEMTASLMLHDSGKRQDVLKCPAELSAILGRGEGYITADDGLALRKWIEGGGAVDNAAAVAREKLALAAEGGTESLKTAWEKLPTETRNKLGGKCPDGLKARAARYDGQEVTNEGN